MTDLDDGWTLPNEHDAPTVPRLVFVEPLECEDERTTLESIPPVELLRSLAVDSL